MDLEKGQIYSVSGREGYNSERVIKYDKAMFVRREHISFTDWYVFLSFEENNSFGKKTYNFPTRVRIPCENIKMNKDFISTDDVLIDKALICSDDMREKSVHQFIKEVKDIVTNLPSSLAFV